MRLFPCKSLRSVSRFEQIYTRGVSFSITDGQWTWNITSKTKYPRRDRRIYFVFGRIRHEQKHIGWIYRFCNAIMSVLWKITVVCISYLNAQPPSKANLWGCEQNFAKDKIQSQLLDKNTRMCTMTMHDLRSICIYFPFIGLHITVQYTL